MAQVRALLLTDVVDSTRMSEELGDEAMAAVWAAHDRVARDLLPIHHGLEIDKTDGFLMLFDDAAEAVRYALAYHAALEPLGLKARAGLHVGAVVLRENPPADVARGAKPLEVDGLAKPVAARVMALARPGQTLLTAEAARALEGRTLPFAIAEHGHWMLKGVHHPVPVLEAGVPGTAPMTPPPDGAKAWRVVWRNGAWTPVREVRHSLPRERDVFVGREADLRELARHLDGGAALVSLLGVGGTGKTRLATHYGWTFLGSWPGGVWFCDLSDARGVDGILHAVATGLGVPLEAEDPVARLGHAIAGRGACLVLLDNFEQVARHAPDTLGRWLDRAPEAQFVATTREVLGLPGEVALALAPLSVPDAVGLFEERARVAHRDYRAADHRPAVEALVKLLDALPLAIELAAARTRVMPPAVLLQRMSERFRLLASTGGRLTRQATLRGALDWSWDLLTPDEQDGLAQLSVFEGGFGLDDAEAVLVLASAWPMDVVQALVDKSLVRRLDDDRFGLLVSVQEYAAEKLEARGGRADAEVRHGVHFATQGTPEAVEARARHGGVALRHALARDLDNLVAACRRAVARADGPVASRTLVAAWDVLELRGPQGVGLELARAVAGIPGLSGGDHAAALVVAARALDLRGLWKEALATSEPALGGAETAELRSARGRMLRSLGQLPEARQEVERSLVEARVSGNRRVEGLALGNLAVVLRDQGRVAEARELLEAALAIHREVGNRLLEGAALANLGLFALDEDLLDQAVELFEAGLAVHREVGNRRFEMIVLNNLCPVARLCGKPAEARTHVEAALAIARDIGSRPDECTALLNLAHLHRQQGRVEEARACALAAGSIARELGDLTFAGGGGEILGVLARAAGDLDGARTHHGTMLVEARRAGSQRNQVVALVHLAEVARTEGAADEAVELARQATALAQGAGGGLEGAALGALGLAELALGRLDDAEAAFDEGEALLRAARAGEDLGVLECGRAILALRRGDRVAAEAALAEARALYTSMSSGVMSELGFELERAERALL